MLVTFSLLAVTPGSCVLSRASERRTRLLCAVPSKSRSLTRRGLQAGLGRMILELVPELLKVTL